MASIMKDRKDVIFSVFQYGLELEYASEELKNDKEVVLTAIKQNGLALQYTSEELKNDKEVVLTAIKQNSLALQYASEELKNDKEVVLTAIKQNGLALQYASEELKNNKEVVLTAVKKDGLSLQYASEELKNNKEVVLTAVKKDGLSLQYASEELKNNEEVVLTAIKQNGLALQHASEELKNDKEVNFAAVRKDGRVFRCISEKLWNDREFVLEIASINSAILRYGPEVLKKDKEVVLIAVKQNGLSLFFADKELKSDKEIVLTAVKQNGLALKFASEELKNNKEVVFTAVKNNIDIKEIADIIKKPLNARELVLELVKINAMCLQYSSEELKSDKEVVLTAAKQNISALKFANKKLLNDKKFILDVVKINVAALQYASEELKKDKELILTAVKKDGLALRYASKEQKSNKEVVLSAMNNNVYSLIYASEELQKSSDLVSYYIQKRIEEVKNKINDSSVSEKQYSLIDRLKSEYYITYLKKVVSKDISKDNDKDFYWTMLRSDVLNHIYNSNEFSIAYERKIESDIAKLPPSKTKEILEKRIKVLVQTNLDYNRLFSNKIISCKGNKEKIDKVLKEYNLDESTIINYILNNKYLSKYNKNELLSIIYQIYDPSKIVLVGDIFELLEEMASRKMTIKEILQEKEIEEDYFYKIYNDSKLNNPVLFDYIKDSLEINKLRGFRKFISRGYIVLKSTFNDLSEFEEKYKITIYDFIKEYKGTELYDKLVDKFSKITDFDIKKLNERPDDESINRKN